MPQCAAFVRALREAFGTDQVIVLYAAENGRQWGDESAREPDAVIAQP
jgi:hypothetical protein